jgi:hypothetical protein
VTYEEETLKEVNGNRKTFKVISIHILPCLRTHFTFKSSFERKAANRADLPMLFAIGIRAVVVGKGTL